ncbi:MAG TPA: hypothetical protein VE991_02415 [Acidimicrobiales bacterium]|nr:hypothetical protein [Acidimicrobiales bacterium]
MSTTAEPSPGVGVGLRVGRAVSAAVVVGSLVTLAVFSLWPSSVRTAARRSLPPVAPTSTPAVAPLAAAPATAPSGPSPVTAASGGAQTPAALPIPAPVVVDGPVVPPTTPPPATAHAVCPAGLPAPATSGGLQSLIGFAPAFGPFSSEAFAMAPAYAPLLQLFGPVIAEFAAQSGQGSAVSQPLLAALQSLDTAGFNLLQPLYGPEREQMLGYEAQFAAALAPYSEQLAGSAAGACLVDLEGMLVSGAPAP